MKYLASKGATVYILTLGVIILFIFIGNKSVISLSHASNNMSIILTHSGILILLFAILLFSFLYAPSSYSVSNSELTIHRPIYNRKIKLSTINKIRNVDKSEVRFMLRTFGNGGLFGIYGEFYKRKLGRITLYATQRKNYVLIEIDSEKILLTPDDNQGFIDDVQSKILAETLR